MRRSRDLAAVGFGLALLVAGACRRDAPPAADAGAPPPVAATAAVPPAESVVYTCQMRVINRTTTPYGEAEAWAPSEAEAAARALPEACRRAGGAAACGDEDEGWSTTTSCAAKHEGAVRGWSCLARAAQGGVAEATAAANTTMQAACDAALAAACQVAQGGPECEALQSGWYVVERVRGLRAGAE